MTAVRTRAVCARLASCETYQALNRAGGKLPTRRQQGPGGGLHAAALPSLPGPEIDSHDPVRDEASRQFGAPTQQLTKLLKALARSPVCACSPGQHGS